MGWRLAEEIAWARPERPGPEWWTLMDIAQDARDDTRQSMCGHEYLKARGKCSRATLYRRLKALTDAKLIIVIRRSAPGIRAIYEIEVIHRLPETGLTVAETRTSLTVDETRSDSNGSHPDANGSQNQPERVSLLVNPTPSVLPRHNTPSDDSPVVGGAVEGSGLSTGQRMSSIEQAARGKA
jgi:hypothetical protein